MDRLDRLEKELLNKKRFYHLTIKSNLESISKNGLIPKSGQRSKRINDNRKAVFLFPKLGSVISLVTQLYDDNELEDLAILEINIKDKVYSDYKAIGYVYSKTPILPQNINLIESIYLQKRKINFSLETYDNIRRKMLIENNNRVSDDIFLFDFADDEGVVSKIPIMEFVKNSKQFLEEDASVEL